MYYSVCTVLHAPSAFIEQIIIDKIQYMYSTVHVQYSTVLLYYNIYCSS